jgi:cytoskeletal protein RodZ
LDVSGFAMNSFGQDLRMERLSRGIALEEITAVTKICQRHLVALEEERFRLLPGGILNKGIVRGYAAAVGLDQSDWTERFLRACDASGEVVPEDRGWLEFATNVGKERIQRKEAAAARMRWIAATLLLMVVVTAAVRCYGQYAGWWPTLLPVHWSAARTVFVRLLSWIKL